MNETVADRQLERLFPNLSGNFLNFRLQLDKGQGQFKLIDIDIVTDYIKLCCPPLARQIVPAFIIDLADIFRMSEQQIREVIDDAATTVREELTLDMTP
ncbi:MAG: hypothetical protein WAO28_03160 [Candidatus Microsaccharimonas sp.]